MKKLSFIMSLICIVMSLCACPAMASYEGKNEVYDQFEYALLDNGYIEIKGYLGYEPVVRVPDTINGKQVRYIGNNAFANCSALWAVVTPDTISEIGHDAFRGCENLRVVWIKNAYTINSHAFSDCEKLQYVVLPLSLDSIDDTTVDGDSNATMLVSAGSYAERACKVTGWKYKYFISPGYSVNFGAYEQDADTDGPEEITWRVLHESAGDATLISEKVLDYIPYDESGDTQITWADSTLRKWMNNDFFNTAFTADQRQVIRDTTAENNEGDDTTDRIFALSLKEANRYYGTGNWVTAYAAKYTSAANQISSDITVPWWLRDSNLAENTALYIAESGKGYGNSMNFDDMSDEDKHKLSDVLDYLDASYAEKTFANYHRAQTYMLIGARPAMRVICSGVFSDIGMADSLLDLMVFEIQAQTPAAAPDTSEQPRQSQITLGSTITLGRYEQDYCTANGPDDIEWIVIGIDETTNTATVISKYCLDIQPYEESGTSVDWRNSSLRRWLNNDFAQQAFNDAENAIIQNTSVGYQFTQTTDRVYILSSAEAGAALYKSERAGHMTRQLIEGHFNGSLYNIWGNKIDTVWYLRTDYNPQNLVNVVLGTGEMVAQPITRGSTCVRPVITIDMAQYQRYKSSDEASAFLFATELLPDDTLVITGYTGSDETVIIPADIMGWQVTEIASEAFANNDSIRHVVIPEGIWSIGDHAFAFCTNLMDVTIPDTVMRIGESAFESCEALTGIDIPGSVQSVGPYAFSGCIALKEAVLHEGTIRIGDSAFGTCWNLTHVELPNTLQAIGGYAFEYCGNLKTFVMPDSVLITSWGLFDHCESLEQVTLSRNLKTITNSMFFYCTSLQSLTIPDGVVKIDDAAFQGCTSLRSVEIPDSVVSIHENAFDLMHPASITLVCGEASTARAYAKDYGFSVNAISYTSLGEAPAQLTQEPASSAPASEPATLPWNTDPNAAIVVIYAESSYSFVMTESVNNAFKQGGFTGELGLLLASRDDSAAYLMYCADPQVSGTAIDGVLLFPWSGVDYTDALQTAMNNGVAVHIMQSDNPDYVYPEVLSLYGIN